MSKLRKLASSFTLSTFLVLIAVFGFMAIGQTEKVYADDYTATVTFVTLDENGNKVDPPTTGGQPTRYGSYTEIENGGTLTVSSGVRSDLISPYANDGYYFNEEKSEITGNVEDYGMTKSGVWVFNVTGDIEVKLVYQKKKVMDPIDIKLPKMKCGDVIKVTEDGDTVTQTPTPGITASSDCGYNVYPEESWKPSKQGWFKSGESNWGYSSEGLFSGKITKDTDVWARVLVTPAEGYDFNWNSNEYEYYGSVSVNGKASSESKAYVGSWCLLVFAKLDPADLEHDWDDGKVTTEPTATETGVKTYTCIGCGETKTEVIPVKEDTTPAADTTAPAKGFLLAQMKAKGNKALDISWTKEKDADGYDIFFARCNYGKKTFNQKKIKTIKGNAKTKWTKKGLKKKTSYKAYVKAYAMENGKKVYIAKSLPIHAYTSGGDKNYTNPKSVTVKKNKATIKVGKTFTIKANVKKLQGSKKLMSKDGHTAKLRYVSNNTSIAKVNSKGKITAVSKGKCTVYAVATNGVKKAVKITVK